VAIDDADADDNLTESSSKSGSLSSPSTPNSGTSFDRPPLSPREEATKKLYEGLGIGRPVPVAPAVPIALPQRVLSQPVRQPRGPPSGADSPSTPNSGTSFDRPPLSPREEATKKLYEGLGIGRPVPATPAVPTALPQRVLSQPVRQPRGPPSGADELGPRNFATRIRRKAIGGLGALMDARERRDVIEAY
jgi:hypothetical protein